MKTIKLNRDSLLDILMNRTNGATFISVETEDYDPKMKKTGNPFANRVLKKGSFSGLTSHEYSNAVRNFRLKNNMPEREVTHSSNGISNLKNNGKNTPIATNRDGTKHYLRISPKVVRTEYVDKETHKTIDKESLAPFFYDRPAFEDVPYITIGLDKIKSVKIDGIKYEVIV